MGTAFQTALEEKSRLQVEATPRAIKRTLESLRRDKAHRVVIFGHGSFPFLYAMEFLEQVGRHFASGQPPTHLPAPGVPFDSDGVFVGLAEGVVDLGVFHEAIGRIIESRGRAHVFLVVGKGAEAALAEEADLASSGLQRLLASVARYQADLSDDPGEFVERLGNVYGGGIEEKRIPELLFTAALLKLDSGSITKEAIRPLVDNLCLVGEGDSAAHFWPSGFLPAPGAVRDLYFESLGLPDTHSTLLATDPLLYLSWCFRMFAIRGLGGKFAEICGHAEGSASLLDKMASVYGFAQGVPEHTDAIETGLKIAIGCRFGYGEGPEQTPPINWAELENQPAPRSQIGLLGGRAGVQLPLERTPAVLRQFRPSDEDVVCIACGANESVIRAVGSMVHNMADEFKTRLTEYGADDRCCLALRACTVAKLLEVSAVVSGVRLSDRVRGALATLAKKCLEDIETEEATQQVHGLTALTRDLAVLSNRYQEVRRQVNATIRSSSILGDLDRVASSEDPVSTFFSTYAKALDETGFMANIDPAEAVYRRLAERYVAISDEALGRTGSLDPTLGVKELHTLAQSLEKEPFERVFVLVVDAFSFLEWHLSREVIAKAAEDLGIQEGYALAAVPTLTPPNTTALTTGYHPSELGVLSWCVKPYESDIVDISSGDFAALEEHLVALPPRLNTTVIHSLGDSPLSRIQQRYSRADYVRLPSTEHRRAVVEVSDVIRDREFHTKVVLIYIADFDHFAHHYLTINAWEQYFQIQAQRIKDDLVAPVVRRARKLGESTLIVLTGDHGKFNLFDQHVLGHGKLSASVKQTEHLLDEGVPHHFAGSSGLAWVPESILDETVERFRAELAGRSEFRVLAGDELRRAVPFDSLTRLENPNLMLFVRSTGGQPANHGGASAGELIVPWVRIEVKQ